MPSLAYVSVERLLHDDDLVRPALPKIMKMEIGCDRVGK